MGWLLALNMVATAVLAWLVVKLGKASVTVNMTDLAEQMREIARRESGDRRKQ